MIPKHDLKILPSSLRPAYLPVISDIIKYREAVVNTLKTWTMEIVGVDWNITNEDLVAVDLKVEQVSRTSYRFSGTIDMRYEFTEDSLTEIIAYRSATGNANSYQLLPYRILKTQIHDFLDQYYEGFLKEFETCSNYPVIETKARDYKFQQLHRFNKCTFTTDPLPNYLPEGYYKAVVQFSGETDWSITCIAHVESIRLCQQLPYRISKTQVHDEYYKGFSTKKNSKLALIFLTLRIR
uniref:Uncharacterized protein n=1 Tax=Glossina brevipalpis TaxID=37001 RepID=A0A1A9W1C0_9MUSC